MEEFLKLLPTILAGLVTLVAAFGGWVWIRKKAKGLTDEWAAKAGEKFAPLAVWVAMIDDFADGLVTSQWDSSLKWLAESVKDGSISKDEWGKLAQTSYQNVKDNLVGFVDLDGLSSALPPGADAKAFVAARVSPAIARGKAKKGPRKATPAEAAPVDPTPA